MRPRNGYRSLKGRAAIIIDKNIQQSDLMLSMQMIVETMNPLLERAHSLGMYTSTMMKPLLWYLTYTATPVIFLDECMSAMKKLGEREQYEKNHRLYSWADYLIVLHTDDASSASRNIVRYAQKKNKPIIDVKLYYTDQKL